MTARVSRSIEHRVNMGDYESVTIRASAERDCDEGKESVALAKLEGLLADQIERELVQIRRLAPSQSYIQEWE